MCGAVLLHEVGGALGIDAHHRAERRAVERDVVGHRADDARRAGLLRRLDAELQLLERRLRLDDDRVGAGVDERLRLLGERVAHLRFGELAVRLHQAAERADVADDVAVASAERLARDRHAGLVDRDDVVGVAVTVEHDADAAERVGQDAVGSGLGVAALDGQHPLGMRQVPRFAAACPARGRRA